MKRTIDSSPVILEYEFPDMGTVRATLHEEAATLYRYFEAEGEVKRLEHLDHLGKLRAVHKCAHYSRWEYVMLQLHFIDQLKEEARTWGLSQRVTVKGHEVSSGEELVKCWVLLLNYCHLEGIFDAERVWVELLCQDQKLRMAFLDALPSPEAKQAVQKCLQDQNYYTIHKGFGLISLAHERKADHSTKWPWSLWMALLESTLSTSPAGSKMTMCREVFSRIRRLVFIALDLNHCPLGIRISTPLLLNRVKENPAEFLYDEESEFTEQLEDLQRILFCNVYASRRMTTYRRGYDEGQRIRYKRLIEKRSYDQLIGSRKRLTQFVYTARVQDFGKIKPSDLWRHYVRLELLPDRLIPRPSVKFLSEQEWLARKCGLTGCDFVFTPTPFSSRSGGMLDVFVQLDSTPKDEATVFWSLLKYLPRYYEDYSWDDAFYSVMTRDCVEQLLGFLMRRFLKEGYSFRLQRHTSPEGNLVQVVGSAAELRGWRRRCGYEVKRSGLRVDRKSEINEMRGVIRDESRGTFLIVLCRILLFDKEGASVGELDGLYFRIWKRSIVATFVEAKRGVSRRSEKARKSLQTTLEKALDVETLPTIYRRTGLAYVGVPLGERQQ